MTSVRILVCEDELIVAKSLEQSLTKQGYTVVGLASSPSEAIALAKAEMPDIALMDIHFGADADDGVQVARTLNQDNIPSIFLTSYSDSQTIRASQAVNPLGYLIKPYKEGELYASIESGMARIENQRETLGVIADEIKVMERQVKSLSLQDPQEFFRKSLEAEKIASYRRFLKNLLVEIDEDISILGDQLAILYSSSQLPQSKLELVDHAMMCQDSLLSFIGSLDSLVSEADMSSSFELFEEFRSNNKGI